MSELTTAINTQVGGSITIPKGEHTIDVPVTVRSTIIAENGAVITSNANCPIIMGNNSAFMGNGVKPVIKKLGAATLFNIAGSNVTVKEIEIDSSQAAGGWDFLVDTSCGREFITLDKINTNDSFGLIADTNNTNGVIVNLHMDNVLARRSRGRGTYLSRAFAFTYLNKVCIDYIGTLNPAAANVPAFVFFGAEGLELESCDVLGTVNNGVSQQQYGFYFNNCRAVTLDKVMADNVGGFGFQFHNCNYVYGQTKASLGGNYAYLFTGTTQNVYLNKFYASGRVDLPVNNNVPLFYADASVNNINMTDGMSERYASLYAGSAQAKINFTNHHC